MYLRESKPTSTPNSIFSFNNAWTVQLLRLLAVMQWWCGCLVCLSPCSWGDHCSITRIVAHLQSCSDEHCQGKLMSEYKSHKCYCITTREVVGGQFQHNSRVLCSYKREHSVACFLMPLLQVNLTLVTLFPAFEHSTPGEMNAATLSMPFMPVLFASKCPGITQLKPHIVML